MPVEPRSSWRPRPRPRHFSRFAKTIVLLLVAIAGTLVLLFWLHFRMTPSFADYLHSQPVGQALLDSLQPAGKVLSAKGQWAIGDDDPFGPERIPPQPRQLTSFELDIRRGDEVLLHLEQEFAVALAAADGRRTGAAVRTVQLTTGDGMRASVRVYVHDVDQLLNPGAGAVTFDVALGAGEGPDDVAVIAIPAADLEATEPVHTRPRMSGLLGRLWPLVDLPETGLLHRVRTQATQSFQRSAEAPGAALSDIVHAVNTSEYSFEVKATLKSQGENGTTTRTLSSKQSFSWNGKLW